MQRENAFIYPNGPNGPFGRKQYQMPKMQAQNSSVTSKVSTAGRLQPN